MSAMRATYWKDESGGQLKYLAGALLLHALLGVLLIGVSWRSHDAIVPQLAINAVLVDRSALNQVARTQAAPPPAEPAPDKQQEDKQKELEKQQQLQREQERQKQEQEKQAQLKQQQALDKQRMADEAEKQKQAQQQAELQRKAAVQAEQQKQQQEAEKKRLADIQQKQREVELKRQADADAKAQAAKEAELKAQLAAEEGVNSAVNAGAQDKWAALIQQRVVRAWIKPPSAKLGLECYVAVTQAVGGTVLSAQVQSCNGDAAVRQSIENAVLSASPLPPPDDPRVFVRNFVLKFKPSE